jgi:hypothetical protein
MISLWKPGAGWLKSNREAAIRKERCNKDDGLAKSQSYR